MSFSELTTKLSFTLKYPNKTSFTYSNIMHTANDTAIIDVADALNSLQELPYTELVRTEITNLTASF